jgi:hypothetical protein
LKASGKSASRHEISKPNGARRQFTLTKPLQYLHPITSSLPCSSWMLYPIVVSVRLDFLARMDSAYPVF